MSQHDRAVQIDSEGIQPVFDVNLHCGCNLTECCSTMNDTMKFAKGIINCLCERVIVGHIRTGKIQRVQARLYAGVIRYLIMQQVKTAFILVKQDQFAAESGGCFGDTAAEATSRTGNQHNPIFQCVVARRIGAD